ncbi:EI24 domain-containing protein [Nocardioides bruguierae]|uniref:EI24 domain-containing protein n=1 Tax=Nocardioides bruguierae TaxID=2945102 RepID=A0A9X2IHL0_9ACTN|nr:EI24 domain-containing protein [Nocardioides bruguierae]MCM0621910.1 EI24 domain-containing protein [Nocardioides bruguierae]
MPAVPAPVPGFLDGAQHLLGGFGMWRRRPGLMVLGMLPALLVLLVVGALLVTLLLTLGDLVAWATPFADGWADAGRVALRVGLGLVTFVGASVLAVLTFTALTLTVGDPFYERIWRATEEILGDAPDGDGLGFWASARDAGVLLILGLATGVGLFVLGLVPFLGGVVGTVLGVLVSGWLLGSELLNRPLEARGVDRAARRELLRGHRAAVLGYGVATQVCFLVPFGGVAVMPAAVVGSTTLARDLLGDPRSRRFLAQATAAG